MPPLEKLKVAVVPGTLVVLYSAAPVARPVQSRGEAGGVAGASSDLDNGRVLPG